ncbi:TPA: hypothetical protein ACMDRK_003338 [Vibrio cholerae]
MSKLIIGYAIDGHSKLFEPKLDDAIQSVPHEELKYHLETVRRLTFYVDAGLENMMPVIAHSSLTLSESRLKELAHSTNRSDWGDFQEWRKSLLAQSQH